jgi:hypothetical protein
MTVLLVLLVVWAFGAVATFAISLGGFREARWQINREKNDKAWAKKHWGGQLESSARWMMLAWVWPVAGAWHGILVSSRWAEVAYRDVAEAWTVAFGKKGRADG